MPAPKKPQDHKKKAAKRLSDEAREVDPMGTLLGRDIKVTGRLGSVTVTVLEDPMQWENKAHEYLAHWQEVGGFIVGEMIPFLRCLVSIEDANRIDGIRPTVQAGQDILDLLTSDDEGEESLEELGESQAS